MNIRELILPFILAMLTWWGVKYFFFGSKPVDQYRFTAPQTALECKPLNKEINFIETKKTAEPTIMPIETAWGNLEFSTQGAALTRLEFKRKVNGDTTILGTIFPSAQIKESAFLVALDNETPLEYKFSKKTEHDDRIELAYHASSAQGEITKTFIVYKNKNQMDVGMAIDPRDGHMMQPRLFYPAPILPALKQQQMTALDVIDGSESFSKISSGSIKSDDGWLKPELFGVENKYFVHAMVNDADSFAQRAYTKSDKDSLTAILEGPRTNAAQSWNLSFYLGPKEETVMVAVAPELEQTLDYSGIWAPISRVLIIILGWLYEFFHNYGIAIIVLTALIRLILTPFALSAERGIKERSEMQKRMQYIQQKYKNDPQARMAAQAELVKANGLGLSSCLPMLIQLPIFFGLSRVLASSITLYQAPFLWIPDLSAPDPYYILPSLFVLGMLLTAVTTPGDAKQKLPVIVMGVIFGAASINFSSGLVLYIVVSVILQTAQTKLFRLFNLAR